MKFLSIPFLFLIFFLMACSPTNSSNKIEKILYLECENMQDGKKYKLTTDIDNKKADITYRGTTTAIKLGIQPDYLIIDGYLDNIYGEGGAGYHGFAINRKNLDMGAVAMPSLKIGKCEKIEVEGNLL